MNNYIDLIESRLPQPGTFEPLFAFSVHKAGSTLMHTMINEVCHASGIPVISIPDILFHEGYLEEWQDDPAVGALMTPGRVYIGFRNLPGFMKADPTVLNGRRSVLLVRDPRDALVSLFYSMGGKHVSHNLPKKNPEAFLNRVSTTAHMEIDEFVTTASTGYLKKLLNYRDTLDFDHVLLRRYEDIYYDKCTFLIEIFEHFGLAADPEAIQSVARKNDIRPEQETLGAHIRKGQPGDYKEKLQPETIAFLNNRFRDVATGFGYHLD